MNNLCDKIPIVYPSKSWLLIGYYFYQALLKAEEVQKFATSQLFKYLVDVLSGKMRAIEKIGQYTDFNTNVK